MAIRFHTRTLLPCQASLLPATAPLQDRTKSCFSLPFKVRCSRLRLQCAGSSKVVEFEAKSVETPAKCDERELPPLFASLNIPGLPPSRGSVYVNEAFAIITKRWPYQWLESYCHSNSWTLMLSTLHPSAVSPDHLAAVLTIYHVVTLLDDVLFDVQHDFLLEKFGLDPNILGNPDMTREYLYSLCDLLLQEEPPQNMSSIQEMTWQAGCDFRKLSNQNGFDKLIADAFKDFFNSSIESHAWADVEGDGKYAMDLEMYTKMRYRNIAGMLMSLMVELGNSIFLPAEILQHSVVQQLILCFGIHVGFVNDIFSYPKEQDEHHNLNLIMVLMASEGMELPEAAWKAVNLTNSVFGEFMELEKQLPVWENETTALIVQRHVEGLKEYMSGSLHVYSFGKRYRFPNAVFPELRDLDDPIGGAL